MNEFEINYAIGCIYKNLFPSYNRNDTSMNGSGFNCNRCFLKGLMLDAKMIVAFYNNESAFLFICKYRPK